MIRLLIALFVFSVTAGWATDADAFLRALRKLRQQRTQNCNTNCNSNYVTADYAASPANYHPSQHVVQEQRIPQEDLTICTCLRPYKRRGPDDRRGGTGSREDPRQAGLPRLSLTGAKP